MTKSQVVEIPVHYAETDASGMAWHGSYAAWLEVGRVELMRHLGLPYTEVESAGDHFAVVELHLRFVAPALFGDTVDVHSRFTAVRSRIATIEYEVRNSLTGQLLANARTVHVCLGPGGKATTYPRNWLDILRRGEARSDGDNASVLGVG